MNSVFRMRTSATALLLVLALTDMSLAQESPRAASLAARIAEVVAPYVARRDFMGVVAVQRDGQEAHLVPCGLASVELEIPHRAESAFMIGSVSKQFTAVAILLLEQEGKLTTDDLVSAHLPRFKPDAPITIESPR